MKRGLVIVSLILVIGILSVSFVSAGWFGDFWAKITGQTVGQDFVKIGSASVLTTASDEMIYTEENIIPSLLPDNEFYKEENYQIKFTKADPGLIGTEHFIDGAIDVKSGEISDMIIVSSLAKEGGVKHGDEFDIYQLLEPDQPPEYDLKCVDSDVGEPLNGRYTAGSASITGGPVDSIIYDQCDDKTIFYEAVCEGGKAIHKQYDCLGGCEEVGQSARCKCYDDDAVARDPLREVGHTYGKHWRYPDDPTKAYYGTDYCVAPDTPEAEKYGEGMLREYVCDSKGFVFGDYIDCAKVYGDDWICEPQRSRGGYMEGICVKQQKECDPLDPEACPSRQSEPYCEDQVTSCVTVTHYRCMDGICEVVGSGLLCEDCGLSRCNEDNGRCGSQSFSVTITNPRDGDIVSTGTTMLEVETNLDAICSYQLFRATEQSSTFGMRPMHNTGGETHSQILFDLDHRWEYLVKVSCDTGTQVKEDESNFIVRLEVLDAEMSLSTKLKRYFPGDIIELI